MKHYLGIDLRPQQVALARGHLKGRDFVFDQVGAYKRAPDDWDTVVTAARAFAHESALVVVSIDPHNVAAQGADIPPYIDKRDIADYAELNGHRNAVRPARPRRIRYRQLDESHLSISIANDEAVSKHALAFEDRGIMLHGLVDPAFAWMHSFAPCGVIDDAGGTTMICYPAPDGTPVMDITRSDLALPALVQSVVRTLTKYQQHADFDHLCYFGNSQSERFVNLRSAIVNFNKELFPVTPPGVNTVEPWTFAAALAYCGAAHL